MATDRIRAYLRARASFREEEKLQRRDTPGQVIDSEFDYTTRKYVALQEQDLQALLDEHAADEVHHTWFSARTPDGALWIETPDPEEFHEQCAHSAEPLTMRKHVVYIYGTSTEIKEMP